MPEIMQTSHNRTVNNMLYLYKRKTVKIYLGSDGCLSVLTENGKEIIEEYYHVRISYINSDGIRIVGFKKKNKDY